MTTYEEWRVTGDPGDGSPPYEFVFSPLCDPDCLDPQRNARRFLRQVMSASPWADSARLQMRTVTVTKWKSDPQKGVA